jgi:hypothetical protein
MHSCLQDDCIYILKLNDQTTSVRFRVWARIRPPARKYKKACFLCSSVASDILTHYFKITMPMPHVRGLLCLSSLVLLAFGLPGAEPADDHSACQSSWDAYWSSSRGGEYYQTTTLTLSTSTLTPVFDYEVPYTTLCDGVRRAAISRATTHTVVYDPPVTTTFLDRLDKPTCPPPYVPCNTYCRLHGSAVKLYYWPVTTTSGDFCTSSGSTVFAEPTSPPNPNTVITDGYTFTSPTNYISFSGLEGISRTRKYGTFTTCGGVSYDNVVVPVTGAMTTKGPDMVYSSLNFEDLNTIRYEAFKAQRRCRNNPCTVVEGFYAPDMALPTEVLDLQPQEWRDAGCKGTQGGDDYYRPRMVPLVTPEPVAKGNMV